jgi:hypothetical protein
VRVAFVFVQNSQLGDALPAKRPRIIPVEKLQAVPVNVRGLLAKELFGIVAGHGEAAVVMRPRGTERRHAEG